MMDNSTNKAKIYSSNASKDISSLSKRYLKCRLFPHLPNSLLNKDHTSTPNKRILLNAPAGFSSTRIFHFSMKKKMKDSFFAADCSFSQIFCTKGACVTEALTEAALSQYPSLPEAVCIFSLSFDCWKVHSSKSCYSKYPHSTGQKFIFY